MEHNATNDTIASDSEDEYEQENEQSNEATPLLLATAQTQAQPHTRSSNRTLVLLGVLLFSPLVVVQLWSALRAVTLFPPRVSTLADSQASGAFSGEAAWAHVENITSRSHSFNSDENLRVRQFIVASVLEFKSLALQNGLPDSWLELDSSDNVNMTTADGKVWYESNNILVRINPVSSSAATNALLLSAHYDTQVVAKGVVDNGIAVAVALELIRTLIYNPPLDHPLLINFNNGEELFLLGAGAFTLHPWFQSVTGFVNLDGTGAALGTRSMLFRTNSFDLLKEWKRWTPYPHASILFNDLVSRVPSDTDYRVYVAYGHLQGVDIAFYSYRYQYHTPDDSVEYSWPISAQHLGDNVRAAVIGICGNNNILDSLTPDNSRIEHPITSKLPIPDFVYYDLFSHMAISTGANFRFVLVSILSTAAIWAVVKSLKEIYSVSTQRFLLRFLRPTFESYVLVVLSSVLALSGVLCLSHIKSFINPGSSYGLPILNILWVAFWVFGVFALVPKVWPRIGAYLLLRNPTTSRNPIRQDRVDTPTPSGIRLQPAADVSRGPPVEKWLPYGLLAFWVTLLIPTLLLSLQKFNAFFFLVHWSFYSLVAVSFTQLISPVALKWWRQQRSAEISPANSPITPGTNQWHSRVIKFYERQIWGVQLLLNTLAPSFLTLDIIDQLAVGLPACIGKAFTEATNDLMFGALLLLLFVNLLPAFQMARKTRLAEFVVLGLFLPIFLYTVFVFPLSRNMPQQFSFAQTWDITTLETSLTSTVEVSFRYGNIIRFSKLARQFSPIADTTKSELTCDAKDVTCTFTNVRNSYLPSLPQGLISDPRDVTELIQVTLDEPKPIHGTTIKEVFGQFKGLTGSRICTVGVSLPRRNDTLESVVDGEVVDNEFVILIDPPPVSKGSTQKTRWLIEGSGKRVEYGSAERQEGFTGVPEVVVLRRDFLGVNGENEAESGMIVPFLIRYDSRVVGDGVGNVTVGCHWVEEEKAKFWHALRHGVPEWMTFGPGRYGGVRVAKRDYFDV
ncbi:UNVERIFIED_CONTAM: hypothetical protein HDU68_003033 [Siphonaria sp. JEL0065]|nr:hypothetical protein HDU68_003033 [Siphonaria sp. JEL0065]